MSYYTDKAITSVSEDLLGRASFSRRLGLTISEYIGTDSLVVGLYGKWGTGKTSVINMAIDTIEETYSRGNMPVIMRFSPWNYADSDALIRIFFAELQSTISADENKQFKKTVSKVLKNYSDILDTVALIPGIGSYIAPVLKSVARFSGEMLEKTADLNKAKNELSKALKKANRRIIVVIDDIDRLNNEQIREIFQLVKQVGDLPNIIYVLLMERDIVVRALSTINNCDGNEYLSKIIQIPFELPEIPKNRLNEIFIEKINALILNLSDDLVLNKERFNKINRNCIQPYLHTLRDVNRVMNVIQFRIGSFYRELALEDLMGIITIEVLQPELYKWIASNKAILCEGNYGAVLERKSSTDYLEYFKTRFKELNVNPMEACYSVGALFHAFGRDLGLFFDSGLESVSRYKTLESIERFKLYFEFNLSPISFSDVSLESIIYSFDEKEISDALSRMYKDNMYSGFLQALVDEIDVVPIDRRSVIASALIGISSKVDDHLARLDYDEYSIIDDSISVIIKLIQRFSQENEIFVFLKNKIIEMDKYSLKILAEILYRIHISSFEFNSITKEYDFLEDKTYYEVLVDLFTKMVINQFDQMEFADLASYSDTLGTWQLIDEKSSNLYLGYKKGDTLGSIKYLSKFISKRHGVWNIESYGYEVLFSDNEIKYLLDKVKARQSTEISELEKMKFAALYYCISYSKSTASYQDVEMVIDELNDS